MIYFYFLIGSLIIFVICKILNYYDERNQITPENNEIQSPYSSREPPPSPPNGYNTISKGWGNI